MFEYFILSIPSGLDKLIFVNKIIVDNINLKIVKIYKKFLNF